MSGLQETILVKEHIKANGRMVDFAGWNMPVQYSEGIIKEHNHTREFVSIFDICHMGELRVTGANAAEELDKLFPRSVSLQKVGICRYNFLLNSQGGVIDDLIIYRMSEEEFFIVVNAARINIDLKTLKENLSSKVTLVNKSAETAKIDLQGPKSYNTLLDLGIDKNDIPEYFKWSKVQINGIDCLISRTGYTGELGYEIYCNTNYAVKMWNLLLSQTDVKPAGLGARDTLRLEVGYPLYGHEMNEQTTPVDAGFGGMFKLDTKREFIGKKYLIESSNSKSGQQLIGIEFDGRRAAREGSEVFLDENKIGIVTSGAFSPSLSKAIAFAYIDKSTNLSIGDKVECSAGRAKIEGIISETPFYKNGSVRKKI